MRYLIGVWVLAALLFAGFGTTLAKGWSQMLSEHQKVIAHEVGDD